MRNGTRGIRSSRRTLGDDRGAILVYMAVALTALTALTTYGVFRASRSQVQTAADAAALAGADAYSTNNDTTNTGPAYQSAVSVARHNLVWGATPSVTVTFPVCAGSTTTCVRADVYPNAANGTLPVFFGPLVGLVSQNVQASAQARVGVANATNCLKPWAVPDLFTDTNGNGVYDAGDVYVRPSGPHPTGYTVANNIGQDVILKASQPPTLGSGWFGIIQLAGPGGADYRTNIESCVGTEFGIGDTVPEEHGSTVGPTVQGVGALIARDPNATWNATTKMLDNSCTVTHTCLDQHDKVDPSIRLSPRIVPVPIFDPAVYYHTGTILIVNICGFFVENTDGHQLEGIMMTQPGIYNPSKGSVGAQSGFLTTVYLFR